MKNGKATKLIALPNAVLSMAESHLMVGGREDVIYDLPCPSFLIEHPKGLVLFDTGCSPKAAVDPVGYWGAELTAILNPSYTPDLAVDRQLKLLGYKLEDVKYVIVSHLHLDHSGGLAMFPGAQCLIMKGELSYAWWPEPRHRSGFILNDLLPTRGFDWREFEDDTDVFGDGSLQMLKTPGHTPGSSSLLVQLPHRSILLTGDAVHIRAQLDTLTPMDIDWNQSMAIESLKRVRDIRESGEVRVWINHDPKDWAELPHSPVAIE